MATRTVGHLNNAAPRPDGDDRRLHVAIIMDGNGRWARARGWPRSAGHRAGVVSIRRVVESAAKLCVGTLTLYAFSADNWKRPAGEVDALMRLFERYLLDERQTCVENGIRVSVIGRRDRLSLATCAAIESTENVTAAGKVLHLRIAIDYSARNAILSAARKLAGCAEPSADEFERMLTGTDTAAARVDLLIRTGGEQRLSDFLLWECAYAELCFSPVLWPEFTGADLEAALLDYRGRERRFGGVPATSAVG